MKYFLITLLLTGCVSYVPSNEVVRTGGYSYIQNPDGSREPGPAATINFGRIEPEPIYYQRQR